MDKSAYVAVVQDIISAGKHGPYAVTKCEDVGSVTFSLNEETWKEKECPKPGTVVVLSRLIKKRAGWRANSARLFKPADEKTPSKKQTAKSKQKGAS